MEIISLFNRLLIWLDYITFRLQKQPCVRLHLRRMEYCVQAVSWHDSRVNAVHRSRGFRCRVGARTPSSRRHGVDPSPVVASLSRKTTNPSTVSMPAAESVTSLRCVWDLASPQTTWITIHTHTHACTVWASWSFGLVWVCFSGNQWHQTDRNLSFSSCSDNKWEVPVWIQPLRLENAWLSSSHFVSTSSDSDCNAWEIQLAIWHIHNESI